MKQNFWKEDTRSLVLWISKSNQDICASVNVAICLVSYFFKIKTEKRKFLSIKVKNYNKSWMQEKLRQFDYACDKTVSNKIHGIKEPEKILTHFWKLCLFL